MSRPYYETNKDLDTEKQVSKVLSEAWNCKLVKMPVKYHLDYAMIRGESIVGFSELKSPKYSLAQFNGWGGFFISLDKFMSAQKLNASTGLPCMIILNATDGIWYTTFHDAKINEFKVKGRQDRGDWQDMEPCVILDTDQFKLFKNI